MSRKYIHICSKKEKGSKSFPQETPSGQRKSQQGDKLGVARKPEEWNGMEKMKRFYILKYELEFIYKCGAKVIPWVKIQTEI